MRSASSTLRPHMARPAGFAARRVAPPRGLAMLGWASGEEAREG